MALSAAGAAKASEPAGMAEGRPISSGLQDAAGLRVCAACKHPNMRKCCTRTAPLMRAGPARLWGWPVMLEMKSRNSGE